MPSDPIETWSQSPPDVGWQQFYQRNIGVIIINQHPLITDGSRKLDLLRGYKSHRVRGIRNSNIYIIFLIPFLCFTALQVIRMV